MSITPLHPQGMPPVSPEPQLGGMNESKIIRRWLWRQLRILIWASIYNTHMNMGGYEQRWGHVS